MLWNILYKKQGKPILSVVKNVLRTEIAKVPKKTKQSRLILSWQEKIDFY